MTYSRPPDHQMWESTGTRNPQNPKQLRKVAISGQAAASPFICEKIRILDLKSILLIRLAGAKVRCEFSARPCRSAPPGHRYPAAVPPPVRRRIPLHRSG